MKTAKKILLKIYEDRKQMMDDMMYFYTEKECKESFGMSINEVSELIPEEFKYVVTLEFQDELELTTWGDYEEVYEFFITITEKKLSSAGEVAYLVGESIIIGNPFSDYGKCGSELYDSKEDAAKVFKSQFDYETKLDAKQAFDTMIKDSYFDNDDLWEIINNLMSLAETLEYVGDYEDGLRGRLKTEVGLTETQLDMLGV